MLKSSRFWVPIIWRNARCLCVIKLPRLILLGDNSSFFRTLKKYCFLDEEIDFNHTLADLYKFTCVGFLIILGEKYFLGQTYSTIQFFAFIFYPKTQKITVGLTWNEIRLFNWRTEIGQKITFFAFFRSTMPESNPYLHG